MAVTAYTLDRLERTKFFRRNKEGVPVPLPFDLVKIDGVDYYEPQPMTTLAVNGKRQSGAVTGAVYLPRNMSLPRNTTAKNPDTHVVWAYYGI